MNKRKLLVSAGGVAFLAGAFFLARMLSNTEQKVPEQETTGKTAVNSVVVENDTISSSIQVTGRVMPADQVDLYAEVTGVSAYGSKPFKTGEEFRRGQVLLRIDDSEFRNALISAKSQFKSQIAQILPDIKLDFPSAYDRWQQYLSGFTLEGFLPKLPDVENEQLKLFLTGRNIYSTYYNLREREARLSKYTIRAPFDGALTETFINRGALVRVGQQLGEYISNDDFELEASVAFSDLPYFKIGEEITLTNVNSKQKFKAELIRINNKVDPTSQLVKVFFRLRHPDLKSGMYLEGSFDADAYENACRVSADVIVGENEVFVIEDQKAVLKNVEVLYQTTNEIILRGLDDGTRLITDSKNRAFAGSEVIEIDNAEE